MEVRAPLGAAPRGRSAGSPLPPCFLLLVPGGCHEKQSIQMAILLVIVVGLVFVIAFASQYLQHRSTSTRDGVERTASRTRSCFPEPWAWSPGRPASPAYEWKVPGTLDFWFENDTAAPVEMGLKDKSCKCTRVEVRVVPREWKSLPTACSMAVLSAGPLPLLGSRLPSAAWGGRPRSPPLNEAVG